jgi:hypothetical protein
MASLAPRNAPTVDILVLNHDESVRTSIQVKTRTGKEGGGWLFGQKHETVQNRGLFYALVEFGPKKQTTYIVPSKVIAQILRRSHQAWLKTPGTKGQPHQDTPMRQVLPAYKFKVHGGRASKI